MNTYSKTAHLCVASLSRASQKRKTEFSIRVYNRRVYIIKTMRLLLLVRIERVNKCGSVIHNTVNIARLALWQRAHFHSVRSHVRPNTDDTRNRFRLYYNRHFFMMSTEASSTDIIHYLYVM